MLGGGAESKAGPVGQPGHPLGPKHRRQRLQQVGYPPSGDDRYAIGIHAAPRNAAAVDGHDRGDLDLGDAEDLVVVGHSAFAGDLDLGIPAIYARGLHETVPETVLVLPAASSLRLPTPLTTTL